MPSNDILDDFDFHETPEWAGDGEVVAKFYAPVQAEIAAARLRSEGIHCFLANTIAQSVVPHIPGFIRLHTRPEDAERARQLLEEADIETEEPLPRKDSGQSAIVFMAILIGVVLASLLVQALKR